MRSLLTQLTEAIGNSIAQAAQKNELVTEKLHLNSNIKVKGSSQLTIKMSDIPMKDLLDAIEKEDADLSKLLTEFIENSPTLRKKFAKKHTPSTRPSSRSRSSSSGGGCGSSASYGGGCGSSSRSSSWGYGGGCGGGSSSRGGC